VLAAAGLVALATMRERLAEDHAHAALIGRVLRALPGVQVEPPATNIVVATLERGGALDRARDFAARGVLVSAMDAATLRLVTHRDVTRADCEKAAAVAAELLG
jgi:threonine aldolase